MSTGTQRNVMGVAVGTNIAGTAIASVGNDLSGLADGQIVALGMGAAGEVVLPVGGTFANYPSIRLVERNGSQFNYSARIFGSNVITWKGIDGVAGTAEQVTTVGYNGSTGSLDATGTNYILEYIPDWNDQQWSQQKRADIWDYYSSSATQKTIAQSFTARINYKGFQNTLNGTGPEISAVMLSDGAAASPATAVTASVVSGSDIVTLNAADAGIQVIGTVLRLGNTNTSATGRGTTVAVYVVVATPSTDSTLTAAQVKIHTYFQGTTDATLDLTTDAGVVATNTNCGIKLTGLPLTWGLPPYSDFVFKKVYFHLALQGFGTSTLTEGTRASKGQGDYRAVAELEYFAMGNEGALNRTVIPLPTGRHQTVTDGSIPDYDTLYIESADTQGSSPITAAVPMRIQNYVFIPDGAAQMTKLLSQLNPWMISTPGLFPNVSV